MSFIVDSGEGEELGSQWLTAQPRAHTYFQVWMGNLACYTSLGRAVWHPAASAYPIWARDYNRWPGEGGKKKADLGFCTERLQCHLPQ